MSSGFKKPGILRASFDYQDLVAISILIDFYRAPDLYEWVELDSDDPQFASIDDIVARRTDGTYEITQVKFTVDPDDPSNQLSWTWLLSKKGSGRSLLQKWAGTVARHAHVNKLHYARLHTDRRPDAELGKCLIEDRIHFEKVPDEIRARISEQIPDAGQRSAFFNHFRFHHSQQQLTDLEYDLQTKLIPSDTDYSGWSGLGRAVKEWATHKNRPEPDGRIRHAHIRAKISRDRPRPLLQNFEVPPDYRPPDTDFDLAFLARVTREDGVTVLWGPPGRGKSTYLSHCFLHLRRTGELCIRHHYFLSVSERGSDRFFFQDIERSLLRQLEELLPGCGEGQTLGQALDEAARQAANLGRRLVIFIDGLDHVWREGRCLEHMQQLFAHLLPHRAQTHIVVGTQRIANRHLPSRLLKYAPRDEWVQLPLMSVEAIAHWLDVQYKAGRFQTGSKLNAPVRFLPLANAFHAATAGLPLQVIYTFEALTRSGAKLTEAAILKLPPSPSGDIRDYYRSLWTSVSAAARNILHSLASIGFALPPGSLAQCYVGEADAVEEIDHLLDYQETGIFPFHGSIFVFVREQPGHEDASVALRSVIRAWLAGPAPEYWKWAWTWLTEAKFDNPEPLLSGPNRAWAIESLCAGYPPEQIELILQEAEELAFNRLDFPRAHEVRAIRIRISNAPEFQTNKFASFVEASLRLAKQDFGLLQRRSTLPSQTPEAMLALLRTLAPEAAAVTADAVLTELNRRIRSDDRDSNQTDWPATLVRVLPYFGDFEPNRLMNYARRLQREDGLISATIEEAILARRYPAAYQFAGLHRGERCEKALFALLCLDRADPRHRAGLKGPARHMRDLLFACRGWPIARNRPLAIDVVALFPNQRDVDERLQTKLRLHDFFFRVAAASLGGRADRVRLVGMDQIGDAWLEGLLACFAKAACALAQLIDRGEPPLTIIEFYRSLKVDLDRSRGFDGWRLMGAVRVATADIAIDLQLLRRAQDPHAAIRTDELPTVGETPLWHDDLWLEPNIDRRLPLHSAEAANAFLDRIWERADTEVIQFMERADLFQDAAIFALEHQLLERAKLLLERAAGCLLGYGWRKDGFAFEILDSVERLAEVDPAWAAEQIRRLAPAYEAITNFTDGDETDHARAEFHALVAKLTPGSAGPLYGHLIRSDEWYYAERLLEDCAERLDLTEPRDLALLRTFIQPSELNAVRKLAESKGTDGSALVQELEHLVGHSRVPASRDRASSPVSKRDRPRSAPKASAFAPERIRAFLSALDGTSGYGWKDAAIVEWLRYWATAGRGGDALTALKSVSEAGHSSYYMDQAYDQAFKLSLSIEGSDAAFYWLVAAQRYRHGWARWYTSSREAEARLVRAAKHYRTAWPRFVLESAEPAIRNPGERSSLAIGQSRLIFFLLKVGETQRALGLAESLIRTILDEVSDQPLSTPAWLA